MSTRYKLYHSPGACSLAAHVVLEELGVPFETVRIVVADGANRAPEYLAINPRGRVPALEVQDASGTWVLTEVVAILVFLARQYPEARLLDEDPRRFARLLEWLTWLASTVHQTGVRAILRPERFTDEEGGRASVVARGRGVVGAALEDIENRLPASGYALGAEFTVLDAYLLVFYRWGNRTGFDVRGRCPKFAAVMDLVRARPAVQRVIEREGIGIDA